MTNQQWSPAALAHELFTAAQLAPGEGIENAVGRLAALVEAQQPAPSAAVATTVPRYTIEDMRQARRESYEQGVASAVPQKVTPAMRAAFREAYKDGSMWTDRLDRAVEALLAAAPQPSPAPKTDRQPAVQQGPVDELAELSLLNRLIDLGNKAAGAHAASNSDDGHKGTAAYVQWQELRSQMGDLIRAAYAEPTTRAAPKSAPVAQGDAEDAARYRWLREHKALNNTHCWHFQGGPIIPGLLTLDAAIDAARKQGANHD